MKRHLSRVVALGVLVCVSASSWAQSPPVEEQSITIQPQGNAYFGIGETSIGALAMIGTFYGKAWRAKSYRGHLVAVRTVSKNGNIVSKATLEVQSSWMGDTQKEGVFSKSVSDCTQTINVEGKATVEKFHDVAGNGKSYLFNKTKNVWAESSQQPNEVVKAMTMIGNSWRVALLSFGKGSDFEVDRAVRNEREQVVLKDDVLNLAYVFDGKSDNLYSWTRTTLGKESVTLEYRLSQTEFNLPLSESVFKWNAPKGAKKVPLGKADARNAVPLG